MASERRHFLVGQLIVCGLLALPLTYLSLAIADRPATPQLIRYIFAPGFVLGMRFASGSSFLDTLGNFGRMAILTNITYYGLICFLLLRRINWPKWPKSPRHHFWMDR